MSRVEARVANLLAAHAKLVAKVQASPKDPKAPAWKARCLEYEASLKSLKETGKEAPQAKPVGVNIEVPVSGFKIEGHI